MTTADQAPRRSRWIPWTFVAMFGVILLANGAMVLAAFSTWSGLSQRDSYRAGLQYNQRIATLARQEALGWEMASIFTAAGPKHGTLRLRLADRRGRAITRARVTAAIVRPVAEGHDFKVPLRSRGNGDYVADVSFPLSGQWEVRYRVRNTDDAVDFVRRIDVP